MNIWTGWKWNGIFRRVLLLAAFLAGVLFLYTFSTPAQVVFTTKPSVPRKILHYVGTHKELLAADGLAMAGLGADAWSSNRCQRPPYRMYCDEQNHLLGTHPTQLDTDLYTYGIGSLFVTLNHVVWHKAPDPSERHLIWFWVAPVSIGEAFNVWDNVKGVQHIQACIKAKQCVE